MTQTLSASRLANLGAAAVFTAFEAYQERFRTITARAQTRFEQRDWFGMRADMAERLDLYREVLDPLVAQVRALLGPRGDSKLVWASMKAVYSGRIAGCHQWELAETFYNSVTRRIFATVGVDAEIEFVDTDFDSPPMATQVSVSRAYPGATSPEAFLVKILDALPLRAPFEDRDRDIALGAARLSDQLRKMGLPSAIEGAEIISALFYRGAAAYQLGRIICAGRSLPLALSIRHPAGGIILDAVLLHENAVSILFSFAHSYFHVEADRPYDLVRQLKLILPRKRIAELYISIGFNKQGKTELYRDLLRHLPKAEDKFDLAPGERGMVMAVFTMPSYDIVFKIIKDRFARPKSTTRQKVMGKYQMVYRNDRAGRLVDAQEFEHLTFPRHLFTDRLVDELCREAGRTVTLESNFLHLRHCYVERRVVPLNVYLREVDEAAGRAAVADYGRCIKDLMAVNIFPGDLLLKNFGVTGNGRVVFYDYDEVAFLTDCSFRDLPAGRTEDEDVTDQPWSAVGDNDVFPAEFARFLGLQGALRAEFTRRHADLFDAATWRAIQAQHLAGEMVFITPYDENWRLRPGTPSA